MAALDGLRVLDLTRVIAGPLAGQTLADLGADVIKIERREGGEDLRSLGPPWLKDKHGADSEESTYFQAANRGKRSLTLDFSKPQGAEILKRLAAKADVLLENFRTGTLARYGLGYSDLAAINPRLIYCSITGFGQEGPYADRSGYDYLVQAMGGLMSINGHPDGHAGEGPMRVGVPIADICTGNNATIAILAALLHREKSGEGQHIDIALFDSQVAILMNVLAAWLNGGSILPRTGNDHPTAVPNGIFPTADGFILISTFNDREFARVAEAMGHPEWARDPRFLRSRDRVEHRAALVDAMSDALRSAGRAEWMERFNAAKISCGPINTMADIESDPQIAARGMIVSMKHPGKGDVRMAGSPLKFSATPVSYRRAPPLAGEHTDEILMEQLGLGQAEVEALRSAEIV
ncbi:CoA transferase [Terrarubrum flagellatum]|uniref:CaiB/BaiF CoA transferase family protein n=1 Tax=Terrirubrum flagellatum TaxID=2895980 RepID=UPI003144D659